MDSRLWREATLAVTFISGTAAFCGPALADCVLIAAPGDTAFICDTGTSGALEDTEGSNTLTLPVGGDGLITGDVTFGGGDDAVEMHSGTIRGDVVQSGGDDSFVISDGTVEGAVLQGNGVDDFVMTGGTIGSLDQSGELDTFFMSGGTIVGTFAAGDEARFTGGTIGNVSLLAADNDFIMSGGTVNTNVSAAFGNDTIVISGGEIKGFVSLSNGTDSVTLTGGSIGGQVRMGNDADTILWDGGGTIGGDVLMGLGDDIATLRNLTDATLALTPKMNGEGGVDTLIFDNTTASTGARFINWESVSLTNGSVFTLTDTFTLGDSATGTGTLDIDSGSRLVAAGAAGRITSFDPAAFAQVDNFGIIDLSDNLPSTRLTIDGNYTGTGGQLHLDTVLGDDSSLSDMLVLSRGLADGVTGIVIINNGGAGADTLADGIQVVDALDDGATTAPGSFVLAAPAGVGIREYLLFQGGIDGNNPDDWFLRSLLVVPPGPGPDPEPPPSPVPPTPGATPAPPVELPGGEMAVPLIRPEVSGYAAAPPAALFLALEGLSTFHDRRTAHGVGVGDIWIRTYGTVTEQAWSSLVDPVFNGAAGGIQAGIDIAHFDGGAGTVGVMGGFGTMFGDVSGDALGWENYAGGRLDLLSGSAGLYASYVGPGDWYVDAVALGVLYGGTAGSTRGLGVDISGGGFVASLEAGYPLMLTETVALEPQGQLIWQGAALSGDGDPLSPVAFDAVSRVTGRLGLRLHGDMVLEEGTITPDLFVNLWHDFGSSGDIEVGPDTISTSTGGTVAELGAGIEASLGETTALTASGSLSQDVSGSAYQAVSVKLGLSGNF